MRTFVIIFAIILLGVFIYTIIELNRQKNRAEDKQRDKKMKGTQEKLEEPKQIKKPGDKDQDLK